nr:unnamed protein product [Spirometra erinaceieuropaei]
MCMIGTIFREGIIASLTGGFFLDPSQGYVVSCIHVYLWLYFFIVPLAITLIKPLSIIAWTVYSITVVLLIGIIQYLTYRLHKTFDECEPIPQAVGFYSDVCNAEGTETLKQRTYDQTGSALSLDSTCHRTAANVYASVENIEAQCRRIGLAGQYLADLMSPPNTAPREVDSPENPIAGPSQPRPPTPIPPRLLQTPTDPTSRSPFSEGCRSSTVPLPRPRGLRHRLGVRMLENRQGILNDKPPPTLPVSYLDWSNRSEGGNLEEHDSPGRTNDSTDDALALCRNETDPYSNVEEASSVQTKIPSGPEPSQSKRTSELDRPSQVIRHSSAPIPHILGPQYDLRFCGLEHSRSLRRCFEGHVDYHFRFPDALRQCSTKVSNSSTIRLIDAHSSASPATRAALRRHIEKLRDEVGSLPYFQSAEVIAPDDLHEHIPKKLEPAVMNHPRTVRPIRSRSTCGASNEYFRRHDHLRYSVSGYRRMSRRRPGSILRLRHNHQRASTVNGATMCSPAAASSTGPSNQLEEAGTSACNPTVVAKEAKSDDLSSATDATAVAATGIYDYPTDDPIQPPEPATTSEGGGLDLPPSGDFSSTPKAEFFRTCSLPESTIAVDHELPRPTLSTLSLHKGELEEDQHVGTDSAVPSMSADVLYSPPAQSNWEISKPSGTPLPAPTKKEAKSTPAVDSSCLLVSLKPSLQSNIYDEILPLSQAESAESNLQPRTSPLLRRLPASHRPQYRRRAIHMPAPSQRPSPRSSRHSVSVASSSRLTRKIDAQPVTQVLQQQQQQPLYPSKSCGADCNASSSHDAVHLLAQPTQHHRRHLRSSFRFPFFPPNVHSLDHTSSLSPATTSARSSINTDKTVVMHQPPSDATNVAPQINLNGVQLQVVDNFTYLSSTSRTTKIDGEVARRISKANQTLGRLQCTVWIRYGLYVNIKLKMHKTVILRTLLYGADTQSLPSSTDTKFEMAGPNPRHECTGVLSISAMLR